ncbi:hypothetical protein [Actinoallomurus iriomotensis]|uniref:Uncharacterized protein n=1 Tax=Actinoallomurus iriomotensis TaxID=478107 RepID=A0A9W6VZH4_9ACTN|nr:hypothetical protein [Actinoallomurus iriomotensis]GLY85895.1 hypothetical protein Airi02_038240 [Actinoallomurus iriomotensis]
MGELRTTRASVHEWTGSRSVEQVTVSTFHDYVCRQGGPHYLAKYDHGVYEFAVDVLDDGELFSAGSDASPDRRHFYQAAGQQLAFMMTALDQQLNDLETGRLIRMVLHAERGAMFCMSVTPKNYVLAIVFGAAAALKGRTTRVLPQVGLVRDADVFVSGIVDGLRDRLGIPSQNPGGWKSPMPATDAPSPEEPANDETFRSAVQRRSSPLSTLGGRLPDLLRPDELVYLAHCRSGDIVAEADLLDHEQVVALRPAHLPPPAMRTLYRRTAEGFVTFTRQLSQLARQAVRGRMLRIVLDVEQGAVYYYRLGPRDYLVGVTVNQKRVSQADRRMGELVAGLIGAGASFGQ